MALADYYNKVQAYFVASLGRPASSAELAQYAGALEANNGNVWKAGLVTYIQAQPDFSSDVATVYKNLTGAEPTMAIYNYYTGKMLAGEIKAKGLANAMINDLGFMPKADGTYGAPANWAVNLAADAGATDLTGVQNKITVANTFTSSLDSVAEATSYATAAGKESAKALLAGVTADADTVTTATANVDTTVANIVTEATTTSAVGQTFTLTKGVDVTPAFMGTSNNDTYRADRDVDAAAGAGVNTLGALDSIDGGAGNDTLKITSENGGTAYVMAQATIANIETITIEGSANVTADTTGSNITGLTALAVTQAVNVDLKASATQDASVSGASGTIDVAGGKNITVTDATKDQNIQVGETAAGGTNAAGTITVTDSKQGTGTIEVDGGTTVAVTASNDQVTTGGGTAGKITVGANKAATGAVTVTQNLSTDGSATVTGGAIEVTGGSTITVNASSTTNAKDETSNADITNGAIQVNSGTTTTAVTVNQTKSETQFTKAAVADTMKSAAVTFKDMLTGESVTVNGLTFTASKALTAAQAASAFANLTSSDTQSATGIVANGIYTNTSNTAAWTSGAASGSTVTFTSGAVGTADITVSDTIAASNVTATVTGGVAGSAATTSSSNLAAMGAVRVDGDTAKTLTSVTVNGYASADLGDTGTDLDGLTTLSLANSAGAATVGTAATTLALTVNKVNNAVTLDSTAANVTNLTLNSTGTASTFALTAAATQNLTVNSAAALDISNGGTQTIGTTNALQSVTVTGAGTVNLGSIASTAMKTFDASANTGGVTATINALAGTGVHADIASFEFSAGNDTVTVSNATVNEKINLLAGDDKITIAGAALAADVDGGTGTNTIALTAANAVTASADTAFQNKIANFQKLEVGQVAASASNAVNMTNMDGISYVITNGQASGVATAETASVTFSSMFSGQTQTFNGLTLTATTDLTNVQVANAFFGTTVAGATMSGTANTAFTAANTNAADAIVTYTSTTTGNVTNIDNTAPTSAVATAPTAPSVVTTNGVAPVTESSVVTFGSLNAGEVATVAGRTVTAAAAVTESASIAFTALATGEVLTIGGMTVTSAAGAATATQIAETFATGVDASGGDLTVTGIAGIAGYTNNFTPAATTVVFTSTTPSANVTDLASTGSGAAKGVVTVTQGFNGVVTAAEVATAMSSTGATIAGKLVVGGTLTAFTASGATANSVTFTSATPTAPVTDISATSTGNQPTVVTTQGLAAVTESSVVTFNSLKSGQSVTVDGVVYTATGDETAIEVAAGVFALSAGLTNFTAADPAGAAAITFTSTTASTPMTDIVISTANAAAPTIASAVTVAGTTTSTDGALTIDNLANNGTVEMKAAGTSTTVAIKDAATGTADVLNAIAKVAASDISFGTLTAANVETINLTATDSNVDEDSDGTTYETGDRDKATLTLTADKATTVNLGSGNANLDLTLTGSTKVTLIDGSSMTGALNVTSVTTSAAITMKGGSGADTLVAASTSSKADKLFGNDGNDSLTAGTGLAEMTGGAGTDTFNITVASANVNSAATIMDAGTGDVIKFAGATAFKASGVTLDSTAVFQDYANAAIVSGALNEMVWFQNAGNTYIVMEKSSSDLNDSFVNGTDMIVKIAGLVDLSTASYNSTSNTLEIA